MKTFTQVNRAVDNFVVALDRSASYSLDRIKDLMDELGNPQDNFKTVHIAGTSGKTSTAYYVAAMLETAGYRTGLSVSPYVEEVNERVQIGTKPLSEPIFCQQFSEFFKIVKRLSIKPTYFELFVAFAYWYFAKIKVDYAVIEVGLGGLLDGTNVIERPDKICVITDIGVDHTHILGSTISEITRQKAGIIKNHNPVFMYHQNEEVEQEIFKQAFSEHAAVHYVKPPKLSGFVRRNWNLAKNVCEYIFSKDERKNLTEAQWEKIAEITIPGRLEILKFKGKTIVLDGAHNSQKISSLAESFKKKYIGAKVAILFAIGENKSEHLQAMADELNNLSDFVIATNFYKDSQVEKSSVEPEIIARYFDKQKLLIEPDLKKAAQALLKRKEDVLLVTGSLYLVGAVKKILKQR